MAQEVLQMTKLIIMALSGVVLGPTGGVPDQGRRPLPVLPLSPEVQLPKAAQQIVDEFHEQQRKVLARAEQQIAPERRAALKRLKALQDQLTQQARLDDALAVRLIIRELGGVRPDPGNLHLSVDQIGKTLRYALTGATNGTVWGTDIYTSDSHLATAAVHAGVLKAGESGVVIVHVLAAQTTFAAKTRHGITSMAYGHWPVSFELIRGK